MNEKKRAEGERIARNKEINNRRKINKDETYFAYAFECTTVNKPTVLN